MNTNHESVAYRSFSPSKFEARGARKVISGDFLISATVKALTKISLTRAHIFRVLAVYLGGYQQLLESSQITQRWVSYMRRSNMIGYVLNRAKIWTTGITGLWQPSVHSDVAF